MQNIFDGVSRGNEDATTELLTNLMCVTYIREMIFSYLEVDQDIYRDIKEDNIETQIGIETVGRPDIIIDTKDAIIFIENKIRRETELQPTQTTSYLDKLNSSTKKYKRMIYIIPDNYVHIDYLKSISQENSLCTIKTWEPLLSLLYEKELNKWNEVVNQSLEHLSDLILQKEVSIKLTREEIVIMLNPKDVINANSLFIKAKEFMTRIDANIVPILGKDFDYSDWSWGKNESEMGKYIRYKNKPSIFYGFNLGLLEEHPELNEYFFALDIEKDIAKKDKLDKSKNEYFEDENWIYLKLDKYKYTNYENVDEIVEELVKKIRESV